MDVTAPVKNQISSTTSGVRKVVEGFRVPDNRPFTANELGWIECLRVLVGDADPPLSLPAVQALQRVLME